MIYYRKTLFGRGPKLTAVHNLATTSPDISKKVDELYEKARQVYKERIDREMPGLAKILEASRQEEGVGI